jgi:hypothetical protein
MRSVLISLVFLFEISSAFATLGGVDVGNGRVINVEIEGTFKGEREFYNHVNSISNSLNNGKYKNIEEAMRTYGCKTSRLEKIKVNKKLLLNSSSFVRNTYSGTAFVNISKCNKNEENLK